MSNVLVLLRLLARWQVLQSILFVCAAMVAIDILGRGVLTSLLWDWVVGAGAGITFPREFNRAPMDHIWLILFYLPAGIGVLCGEAAVQLLVCPYSYFLPAVRRKLLFCLLIVGSAILLGVTVFFETNGGGRVAGAMGAVAFLSFGLGTALADPYPGFRLRATSLLLLLVFVAVLPLVLRELIAWRWMLGPVALAGGIAYQLRLVSPRIAREKAVAADHELGPEYSPHPDRTLIRVPRTKTVWPVVRMGTATGRWIRAAIYEHRGRSPAVWIGIVCAFALGIGGLVALLGSVQVPESAGTVPDAWENIYRAFAGPGIGRPHESEVVAIIVWIGILVFESVGGFSLRKESVYPLSRRDRARLVFWGGLVQSTAVFATLAIVMALLAESAFLIAGLDEHSWGLPHYVRVLVLSLPLYPLLQWSRLRFLSRRSIHEWPIVHAGFVAIVGIGIGLLVGMLSVEWARLEAEESPVVLFAGVLVAMAVVLGAYRHLLARHFARCDLV